MSFVPGQEYPIAFFVFDSAESDGNYAAHAAKSVLDAFRQVDPMFSIDQEVFSGDLLPNHMRPLASMIRSDEVCVDLSRVHEALGKDLQSGNWPTEHYMIGIPFVVAGGVDIVHQALSEAAPAGYSGLFTVLFRAGTTELLDLARVLGVSATRFANLM